MAELHIIEARRLALDIFSLSSTIYPCELKDAVTENVIIKTFEFSCNAYRINELCELKDQVTGASASRFSLENSSVKNNDFEDNYLFAIHKIRHAKDLTLGWAIWDGSNIFLNSSQQLVPTYIICKDCKHPGTISIFGTAFTFLTYVIQQIRIKHPELRF
ncbi:hypothetical protein MMB17_16340 [Methylobacterium organophilum]|uniref:hypothetical protein n=1 Tax=Methylobacterium organophilum TaxID=410 RepID=UPI001F145C0C|nr:hypothetical protein [Methylobacterium organophilum]UMY16279.1 hypothetical protein MMB17_16340 [Methylobacterium organophilum]